MKIFPSIDIKNGQCVGIRQGKFHDIDVYENTPLKVATLFEQKGARQIHINDLNGEYAGRMVNSETIGEIAKNISIPIQISGKYTSLRDVEIMLSNNVERIVIGTNNVTEPLFLKDVIENFGKEHIVASVEGVNGMVTIEGWEKVNSYNAVALCMHLKELGLDTVIYRDVPKALEQQGSNLTHATEIEKVTKLNLIISGGINSLNDLEKISNAGFYGALFGNAIYDNRINIEEAVRLFEK